MKKYLAIIFSALLICILAACSANKGASSKILEADIREIAEGLAVEEDFHSDFTQDSAYKYIETSLTKRQTNTKEKQDIVFYDVTLQSDYFKIVYSYKLIYNYYDEGGWILDDKALEEKAVTPIKAADTEQVFDLWLEKEKYANKTNYKKDNEKNFAGDFSECKYDIVDKKTELDSESMETRIYLDISNSLSHIKGYIPLAFDTQDGWYIPEVMTTDSKAEYPCLLVTELNCDYTKAEGDFESGSYSLSLKINEQQGTVDYVYSSSGAVVQKTQTSFDPITGAFLGFEYYDADRDIWIGRSSDYYRK